jgi:hypothetical protein
VWGDGGGHPHHLRATTANALLRHMGECRRTLIALTLPATGQLLAARFHHHGFTCACTSLATFCCCKCIGEDFYTNLATPWRLIAGCTLAIWPLKAWIPAALCSAATLLRVERIAADQHHKGCCSTRAAAVPCTPGTLCKQGADCATAAHPMLLHRQHATNVHAVHYDPDCLRHPWTLHAGHVSG